MIFQSHLDKGLPESDQNVSNCHALIIISCSLACSEMTHWCTAPVCWSYCTVCGLVTLPPSTQLVSLPLPMQPDPLPPSTWPVSLPLSMQPDPLPPSTWPDRTWSWLESWEGQLRMPPWLCRMWVAYAVAVSLPVCSRPSSLSLCLILKSTPTLHGTMFQLKWCITCHR